MSTEKYFRGIQVKTQRNSGIGLLFMVALFVSVMGLAQYTGVHPHGDEDRGWDARITKGTLSHAVKSESLRYRTVYVMRSRLVRKIEKHEHVPMNSLIFVKKRRMTQILQGREGTEWDETNAGELRFLRVECVLQFWLQGHINTLYIVNSPKARTDS